MNVSPRARNLALILFATLIVACGCLLVERVWHLPPEKTFALISQKSVAAFYLSLRDLFRISFLSPAFWVAILLTLGLQWLLPAKPTQKIFSVNFAQDLIWFFYETVLQSLIVVTYVDLLIRLYDKYFSFLTVTSLSQLPGWMKFLISFLMVDFLYWAQHYCNHKVPFLWKLHSLHHSQKELNFFTDFRYHVLEYVVRHTFLVIPLLILRVDAPTIVAAVILLRWYSRFYHGNIKTNLGPLRYVLVTPQSHRVHHSIEPVHRDTNFGAILSIWDFAFGTQCRDYNVYPNTGITDEHFPHETTGSLKSLLVTPFRQLIYPFSRSGEPADSYDTEAGLRRERELQASSVNECHGKERI